MTDKERLEEIKEWFENDGEMHEFQIGWLIEQSGKVEQLEKRLKWCLRVSGTHSAPKEELDTSDDYELVFSEDSMKVTKKKVRS